MLCKPTYFECTGGTDHSLPAIWRLLSIGGGLWAVNAIFSDIFACSAHSNQTDPAGYPLSQFVQYLPGHTLSYAAKEVACHAIEMYASRLENGADNLKVSIVLPLCVVRVGSDRLPLAFLPAGHYSHI